MADLEPGTLLGDRFEIAGVLGRGGMATVYLAQDRVRGERVALKVLHAHLASQPASRERLRREVAAAARIRHPRALVASELFELQGTLALSMPLHPGNTLAEDIATRGPMGADALWALGASLAGALAEAHRVGVIHRDVSPGNVLVDRAREGTLTDFGLARLDDAHSRTATTALGTAGFTAPEVLEGQRAGPAADLYGLGGVLYLAATGQPPFDAPSPMAVLVRQAEGRFVPLATARPDLPVALRDAIEALIARDPAARPESARAVADAFARREGTARPRAAEPSTALLVPPELPAGTSRVLVREGIHQPQQRRRRRRRERRKQRAGFEGVIEGLTEKVERTVRDAMGLPPGREPEALLRDAVAEEARLPPDALREVPALRERRFRLVDGVSADVAQRLAEQARAVGFRASVRRSVPEQAVAVGPGRLQLLGVLLGIWSVILGGVTAIEIATALFLHRAGPVLPMPLPILLVAMVVVRTVLRAIAGRVAPGQNLPLAYGADLRPYLTAAYANRAAPAPESAPADPETALYLRTGERLAALEQAIASSAGRLPAPAILDLQATLAELRARARAIEAELRRIDAEATGTGARADDDAAGRIDARIERLQTRARGGEAADPSELADLERARRAHQERIAAAEQEEQRRIRLTAALLEIGASAENSRRALLHEPDLVLSVEDLLGRLKADGANAAAAMDEVADARRRAAARQAQRG